MRYALLSLCALLLGPLKAAELRQPLPDVYAIVDVRIVTEPGEVVESGTVVVRDGVIEAVGADVAPPADARIVEFEREDEQPPVTVFPGLVEPYLVVGGNEDDERSEDGNDSDDVPGRHPLVRPDRAFGAGDWPAEAVEAHRRAGFTTALMVPGEGLFRGRSLLANLGDGGLSANLLDRDVAQHAHLHERHPDGKYPQSLMGSVALFRQTLADAGWQQRARQAWNENPAQARPEWLAGVDALGPVIAGDQPLVFESRDLLDSLRILDLVDEDLELVLVGHGAEYKRLGDFDRKVPHILPVDFPDAPDVEDEQDRDVPLEALRHWQRAPSNPARLVDAGFPLLLTAWKQSAPTDLFAQVAKAVEQGLDADTALASLTTAPAAWLGIGDRAGRIAEGYMANLLVVEGDLFAESPTISEVWVDGVRFELAKLEPPEVDPVGTWDLRLGVAGMGEMDAELVLTGEPTALKGSLTVMGSTADITEGRVSGNQVQLRIDASDFGASGTISLNLDVEGDRGRGNGTGPYGEFTVRGERTGPPGDTSRDEETRT
ncbi:MAG: amidohydrolase family protein [Candidatus Wenzhouxiangella sp. M2_3B_020]